MYVLKKKPNLSMPIMINQSLPVEAICLRIDVDVLPSSHNHQHTAWIYLDEQLNYSVEGDTPFEALERAWEWIMDKYEMVEENDEIEVNEIMIELYRDEDIRD